MEMKNRWVAISLMLTVAACASSTGVMKLGPDTYRTSAGAAPALGGSSGAQKIALDEGRQFCEQQRLEILVMNISTETFNNFGAGIANITFRCLAKDDPEYVRPTYTTTPTTVIEDRRQR